jgi:hypothetical protein
MSVSNFCSAVDIVNNAMEISIMFVILLWEISWLSQDILLYTRLHYYEPRMYVCARMDACSHVISTYY